MILSWLRPMPVVPEHAVDRSCLSRLAHFIDFVQHAHAAVLKWIRGMSTLALLTRKTEVCERCMEMAINEYRNREQLTKEKTIATLAELKPERADGLSGVWHRPIRRRIA